jgi:hypothetical protein
MPRTYWHGGGRMSVELATTVSGLHEVAVRRSCCLLICRVHPWVILLAVLGSPWVCAL